jgi:hypothetical protein
MSNKTTDGLPGYNVNVSDDQQPEFRNLSEFYIHVILFLNKQKNRQETFDHLMRLENSVDAGKLGVQLLSGYCFSNEYVNEVLLNRLEIA